MTDLSNYYQTVQEKGSLRTPAHAQRWSTAVLKTLGFNLGGKTKKKLANALPKELADDVKRVFWLAHFKNDQLTSHEFQTRSPGAAATATRSLPAPHPGRVPRRQAW
ncbi:MAG: DUF2267 domain-containing protein [Chloroflexota bacterium]